MENERENLSFSEIPQGLELIKSNSIYDISMLLDWMERNYGFSGWWRYTYSERVIPMVEKQCNTRCPRLLTVAEMAWGQGPLRSKNEAMVNTAKLASTYRQEVLALVVFHKTLRLLYLLYFESRKKETRDQAIKKP